MTSARKFLIARIVVSVLGLGLALAVPAKIGFASVLESVKPAMSVLPICVFGELLRVLCEAAATRLALGRKVPWGPMALAHLGSYAAVTVFPAPRPAAEAVKATVLGEHVGLPEAASAGATIQSATFLSVGSMCLIAAVPTRGTTLMYVLLANAALTITLGVVLRAVMRSASAAAFLSKKWPKRRETIARLHAVACTGNIIASGPTACLLLSLFIRVLEQWFITRSMGGTATLGFAVSAEGVRLLGASIGVLVPGQMGVRETVFALSADSLGAGAAQMTAVSLFTHIVELSLALVGFIALVVFRAKPKVTAPPPAT